MSFRAYFEPDDGTFAVDEWDSRDERFAPDGETYFATREEATRRVAERMRRWLGHHQKTLADLEDDGSLLSAVRRKSRVEYDLTCERVKSDCRCSRSLCGSSPEEIVGNFDKAGFVLVNGKVFCDKHAHGEGM